MDAVYPFDAAAEAHRRLADRRNVGKVVLVSGSGSFEAGSSSTTTRHGRLASR
ncbi:MAG TPA: zinc-binding dehydrogenase [Solirubrobacteraceae bacterium]